MEKKKCYISGRISGLPRMEAERNFSSSVLQLVREGYIPVNPMNNGVPYWMPWCVHMVVDLFSLAFCDTIALQDNWRESRGARIEYRFAIYLGKDVIFLK